MKSPKQEAKEIFDFFYLQGKNLSKGTAKKFAVFTVQKILKESPSEYYQHVLNELENL